MSDTPPTTNETSENTPTLSGGWQKPSTPGAWRTVEQAPPSESQGSWRVVPALPEELEPEPEEKGSWHLPAPEDTPYTPEDQAELRPPEDELLDRLNQAAAPQDATLAAAPKPPEPVAPEDLIYLMEHMDEQEEDDDSVPMSELIALASLSESSQLASAIQGAESPFQVSALPFDEEEDDNLEMDKLSPAERLVLQETGAMPAAEDDAAAYARQQLEALTGGGDSAPAVSDDSDAAIADPAAYARQQLEQLGLTGSGDAATGGTPTDANDPAAYARQQLAQLGGAAPVEEYTPLPQATEPLDPRKQELLRKYTETQNQVRLMRQQVATGQMTQDDYMNRLRDMMILDDDQNWWMIGVDSDQWYKSENNQWVAATPPVIVEAAQRPQASAATGFNSLPYLPDQPVQPASGAYGEYSPVDTSSIPLDRDFMPLPKQVPVYDPDLTVPSPSVFDIGNTLPNNDMTVPNAAYNAPTVQAQAYNYGTAQPVEYGTIESPFDETEPPDYEDLDTYGGDVYEKAIEEQRRSLTRYAILGAVVFLVVLFLSGAAFILGALLWYQGIVDEWKPGIAALGSFEPEFQTVTVQDSAGNIIATLGREGDDRRPVDIDQMSPYLIHAFLSLENPRFYNDPGWDFFSIMRAFFDNFVTGEITSGASTITQQVARNLVLQSTEVTADRKVNEVIVSGEITNDYTKSEILELYLNEVVFFGNQTYGVEAASQFYFGKSAANLNWPEAAMLAGIVQAPLTNEPVNNKETALQLMRATMRRMVEVGCITFEHNGQTLCPTQADLDSGQVAIDIANVQITEFSPRQFGVRYPHFTQRVQAELEAIFGPNELYRGGYTVRTTLDPVLQNEAQQAVQQRVRQLGTSGVNTGSAMVIDPRNGAILAWIGSPDFDDAENQGQINYALSRQQPGSSIKPILYAAALSGIDFNANGVIDFGEYYTPATVIWDVPTTYSGGYTPRNFDNQFRGPISARQSIQNSLNIPAIKTYEFVGTDAFIRTANAMGIGFAEEAQFNLTTAVGSTEVLLIDMVQAYGTIANGGQRMELYTIESIVDANGNPIPTPARAEPVPAISPQVAFLLQNILSDDAARQSEFGLNSPLTINGLATQDFVGAKTGTTDGGRDLWTMGFTSNRVVGVWLGTYDDTETFNQTGFTAAAPLWNQIMRAALNNNNPRQFAVPSNGTVVNRLICADTGTETGSNCSAQRNEYFVASQPPPPASLGPVTTLEIDTWAQLIANEFCPDQRVQQTFANITDPFAINWINTTAQGQAYAQRLGLTVPVEQAPQQACSQSTVIPVARISNPGGGQTLQGVVTINGQVSAPDFNRYQLEYAAAGTQNFQPIGAFSTAQQPNANSVLGTWDTSGLPTANYVLRLAMFSNNGGYLYRTVDVVVNNPLPTATPLVPTAFPTVPPVQQFTPIPFDPVQPGNNGQSVPSGPTPTIDPLAG